VSLSVCESEHVGFVDQGTLMMTGTDGGIRELNSGDCYVIMPGHVCWAKEGPEELVLYEFDTTKDQRRISHPHTEGSDFDGVLSSEDKKCCIKSFENPDDVVRGKDDMFVTMLNMFESSVIKKTIGKPGASWAEHIRPCLSDHVNCEHVTSCFARQYGFLRSGLLEVTMDDVNHETMIVRPMDAFVIEPGHNAKVISTDEVVMYEFSILY
jgi:mannose-6-phosphate isomerase-like protein (cupin superfamily)